MSQWTTTAGDLQPGQLVQTATGRIGKVVSVDVEYAPQELGYWDDGFDEPMHHVYTVEFKDAWDEPFVERWPEDFLTPTTILDLLA